MSISFNFPSITIPNQTLLSLDISILFLSYPERNLPDGEFELVIVVAAGQQVFGRKVGKAADGSPLDDVIGRNIDRRH